SKVGENMGVARFMRYELASEFGLITVYVHGVGNIGVMVEVAAGTSEAASSDAFALLGRDLAMQIAAVAPYAVSREKIEQSVVDHELSIYKAQAAESGKPEPIQQKIAEGRLEKFFKEVTLLEQDFVKDSDKSVRQYIDAVAKNLGTTIEVVRFDRFVMGQTADSGE
ncbi:MAG: translation elongation factor Ts, partial [Actinomycetota bacterium]|nr:translation elongation factor Ts [Actinomycetota bacterium]